MGTGTDYTEYVTGHFALNVVSIPFPAYTNKIASANVRNSNDIVVTSSSVDYVVVKTITLIYGLIGQQRFMFDIKTSDATITAHGLLFRNGSSIGLDQYTNSTTYVTSSQDITQDWQPGDEAQLGVRISGIAIVSVRNFRIAYDNNPIPVIVVPSVNSNYQL